VSPSYRDTLDYETGARIVVEFTARRREVLDYAVILTVEHEGESARAKECEPRSSRFAPTTER
jgi:hypothetical protein